MVSDADWPREGGRSSLSQPGLVKPVGPSVGRAIKTNHREPWQFDARVRRESDWNEANTYRMSNVANAF